jgi:hypothetical protein
MSIQCVDCYQLLISATQAGCVASLKIRSVDWANPLAQREILRSELRLSVKEKVINRRERLRPFKLYRPLASLFVRVAYVDDLVF